MPKPGEGLRRIECGDLFAADPEVTIAAVAAWNRRARRGVA